MAGSLFFPLLLSFDRKVAFYKYWWRLFPAIAVGAAVYIPWDQEFTRRGIWHFNQEYVQGTFWGQLPAEEWAFFFVIPYCCVFIYECLKAYFRDILKPRAGWLFVVFLVCAVILAIVYRNQLYTLCTFSLLAVLLLLHFIIFRTRHYGRIFAMFFVHLVPLFVVNGVLTALPVVIYDDTENMAFRLGTVPFEDSFYSLALLLIVITVYEALPRFITRKKSIFL